MPNKYPEFFSKPTYTGAWNPRRRRTDWDHDYVILAEPANEDEGDADALVDDEEDGRAPS
jgi:hypothetical protein